MRILMMLALGLSLFAAAPAMAQDGDAAHRMALASRYLELTQEANLRKTVETYFADIFAKADMPEDQRVWWTENTASVFDTAMAATVADMTDDVAEIYTTEELEAIIAFSETPVGRSITAKSFDFGIRMQTVMMPHLTTAIGQLGEKYCARFDCPTPEGERTGKPID